MYFCDNVIILTNGFSRTIDTMNDDEEQQLKSRWNQIFNVNDVDSTIRITYTGSLPGETFNGHVSVLILVTLLIDLYSGQKKVFGHLTIFYIIDFSNVISDKSRLVILNFQEHILNLSNG